MPTRAFPTELSRLERQLLEAVSEDALEGRAARSNAAYADAVVCAPGTVIETLRRLQDRRLIEVERRKASWQRRIALLDGGEPYARTGWSDDPDPKAAAHKRPCITCREKFVSEGPHNRMCERCRHHAKAHETYGFGAARRSSGAAA